MIPDRQANQSRPKPRRGVIKEEFLALTGSVGLALILSQFEYMLKKNSPYLVGSNKLFIEEERRRFEVAPLEPDELRGGWLDITAEQIKSEALLQDSLWRIRELLKSAIKNGWLKVRRAGQWDNTRCYRLDLLKIKADLEAIGYCLLEWETVFGAAAPQAVGDSQTSIIARPNIEATNSSLPDYKDSGSHPNHIARRQQRTTKDVVVVPSPQANFSYEAMIAQAVPELADNASLLLGEALERLANREGVRDKAAYLFGTLRQAIAQRFIGWKHGPPLPEYRAAAYRESDDLIEYRRWQAEADRLTPEQRAAALENVKRLRELTKNAYAESCAQSLTEPSPPTPRQRADEERKAMEAHRRKIAYELLESNQNARRLAAGLEAG